jgi:hypothetical protein
MQDKGLQFKTAKKTMNEYPTELEPPSTYAAEQIYQCQLPVFTL